MPEAPPPFPVIEQPTPRLTWYHYAWIGWPLIMVILGGAARPSQKTQNTVLRYVWTGLISATAVMLYLVIATVHYMAIHKPN